MEMWVWGEVFESLSEHQARRATENNLPGKTASAAFMEGRGGFGNDEAGFRGLICEGLGEI